MCGICGIAWGNRRGLTPDEVHSSLSQMVGALRHRGPDDNGVRIHGRVGLGMTRLAVLDTSRAGHQPMRNEAETLSLVFNGEIYNFKSEREQLESKGYSFRSASDTEVVLRMYEHYGDDFVQRLRGMFALAIHDTREGEGRERLLLARDHLGIKPLLYTRVSGTLLFASEIKALLASRMVTPEVDLDALRTLLTYGAVYQPRTLLKGVQMLLPAHRLIVDHMGERVERFWTLGVNRVPHLRAESYDNLVTEMTRVLDESVRLQMVSDVPLGAFLSGGIDSSLLVALMTRHAKGRIKTFSVGFEQEGHDIDETSDAARTAAYLGTEHTNVIVRGDDVRDSIEEIAWGLDQPSVDGVNSFFVSRAARRDVTVAISGTGGDELFAGYPWFIRMVLAAAESEHPQSWRSQVLHARAQLASASVLNGLMIARWGGDRLGAWRDQSRDFISRYATNYHIFGVGTAARLLSPASRAEARSGRAMYKDLAAFDEIPNGSPIERVTGLCLRGYTTNQLLRDIDAVSMINSLEVRVPFLDPVVADVALSLPDSAKIGDLTRLPKPEASTYRETGAKRILLDVGREFLPKGFDDQPKRGFAMPFSTWLCGPLREVMEDTLSLDVVRRRGLLSPDVVTKVKDAFLEGDVVWAQPWLLMMIELWCRGMLDQAYENVRCSACELPEDFSSRIPKDSGLETGRAG